VWGEVVPICPKCLVAMRLAVLADVPGPNERICYVSVFACKECGRLLAYELPRLDEHVSAKDERKNGVVVYLAPIRGDGPPSRRGGSSWRA
jgi:hypothetical protein